MFTFHAVKLFTIAGVIACISISSTALAVERNSSIQSNAKESVQEELEWEPIYIDCENGYHMRVDENGISDEGTPETGTACIMSQADQEFWIFL